MPRLPSLDRLTTGIAWIDQWIDMIVSAIERALNVTASDGIAARLTTSGIHLTLENIPQLVLAKSGAGGIPARSGNIPQSANVTIYQSFDGTNAPMATYTDKAYNLGGAVAANTWLILGRLYGKYWFVVVEVCA